VTFGVVPTPPLSRGMVRVQARRMPLFLLHFSPVPSRFLDGLCTKRFWYKRMVQISLIRGRFDAGNFVAASFREFPAVAVFGDELGFFECLLGAHDAHVVGIAGPCEPFQALCALAGWQLRGLVN